MNTVISNRQITTICFWFWVKWDEKQCNQSRQIWSATPTYRLSLSPVVAQPSEFALAECVTLLPTIFGHKIIFPLLGIE